MCSAPYLVTLEEDWEIIPGIERSIHQPKFVEEAISIIKSDEHITGVLLRGEREWFAQKTLYSMNTSLGEATVVRRCFDFTKFPQEKCAWGGYTNGAAVYDRMRVQQCAPFVDRFEAECEMTNCHSKNGMCTASVWRNRESGCTAEDSVCNRVAEHIGAKSTWN